MRSALPLVLVILLSSLAVGVGWFLIASDDEGGAVDLLRSDEAPNAGSDPAGTPALRTPRGRRRGAEAGAIEPTPASIPDAAEPLAPATVVGSVVVAPDMTGLPGVEVVLAPRSGERERRAFTDERGGFVFTDLDPNLAWVVGAEHPDWGARHRGPFPVEPGDELILPALVFAPAGSLFGTVRDSRGRVAPLAEVAIRDRRRHGDVVAGPFETPHAMRRVRTDDEGRYRIDRLGEGYYVLGAHAEGYGPCHGPEAWVGGRGSATRHDLVLPPEALLSGRIVDADERGIAGLDVTAATTTFGGFAGSGRPLSQQLGANVDLATVLAHSLMLTAAPNRLYSSRARTGPDGRFVLGALTPGEVTFWYRNPNGLVSPGRRVEVPEDDLVVVAQSGGALVGRIFLGDTSVPLARGRVDIEGPTVVDVRTDDRGRFRAGPLLPGLYRIRPRHREYTIPLEEKQSRVAVAADAEASLDLILVRAAELRGRVVDRLTGLPIAGARVGPDPERTVITEIAGRFICAGLELKRGRLVAFAEGYGAEKIKAPPSGKDMGPGDVFADVVIELVPLVALAGIVRSFDGPVAGALVQLASPVRDTWRLFDRHPGRTVTGPDGRFVFEADAPSGAGAMRELAVITSHVDFAPAVVAVGLVTPGGAYDLDIVLEPSVRVTGRVLDLDGAPVGGTLVRMTPRETRVPGVDTESEEEIGLAARTDADGAFAFATGPWPFSLAVDDPAWLQLAAHEAPRLLAGSTPAPVTLKVAEAERLRGRVYSARNALRRESPWLRVVGRLRDGTVWDVTHRCRGVRFDLRVPAGRLDLHFVSDAEDPALRVPAAELLATDGATFPHPTRLGVEADGSRLRIQLDE